MLYSLRHNFYFRTSTKYFAKTYFVSESKSPQSWRCRRDSHLIAIFISPFMVIAHKYSQLVLLRYKITDLFLYQQHRHTAMRSLHQRGCRLTVDDESHHLFFCFGTRAMNHECRNQLLLEGTRVNMRWLGEADGVFWRTLRWIRYSIWECYDGTVYSYKCRYVVTKILTHNLNS